MTSLVDHLRDKELIFVTGKGGVGKSTLSASLSLNLSEREYSVLTFDVDPEHSLPDVFGVSVRDNAVSKVYSDNDRLSLHLVSPDAIVAEVRKNGDSKEKNRANGLPAYHEVMHLFDVVAQLGVPVAAKDFASLNTIICEREEAKIRSGSSLRVVSDLEPSYATLELLECAKNSVDRLGVMAKHRKRWGLVARAAGWPDIANFASSSFYLQNVSLYQEAFKRFYSDIQNPDKTAFVIVSSPEPVVLRETTRLRRSLESKGFPVRAIVFNKDYRTFDRESLRGSLFEHTPDTHRDNVDRYIKENRSFTGRYFSVPYCEIGVAREQVKKREFLGSFVYRAQPLG